MASNLKAMEVSAKLFSWFQRYGTSAEMEIEARVREVDDVKFEELLKKLRSFPGWTAREEVVSTDILHESGVRETRPMQGPSTFMFKEKIDQLDVFGTDDHHPVRLSVSSERPVRADNTAWRLVRHKKRHTFVHKGTFKFELTEVKQGPSWETASREDSEFEVEVEYCGQAACRPEQKYFQYLVQSFLGKVLDAAAVSSQMATEGLAGAKRQRVDGALACGDVVRLAPGTVVDLEPVLKDGRAQPPPALTAAEAQQVLWVCSGIETGMHGEELAHVMSLPSTVGSKSYALYHFTGHVPRTSVAKEADMFGL